MTIDASIAPARSRAFARLHALTLRRGLPVAALRPDWQLLELNGERLLTPGRERNTPAGRIFGVAYRAELRPSLLETLVHLADSSAVVTSRRRILGEETIEEFEAGGADETLSSLQSAIAAAASALGYPMLECGHGARIDSVREDTLALHPDERIVAVSGTPVTTAAEVRDLLSGRDGVTVTVQRNIVGPGVRIADVPVTRHHDGTWGLQISTDGRVLQHSLDVRFTLPGDLAGPSLGLACALSTVDAHTGGRLARHGDVVATGVVTSEGNVTGIGGVLLKARAAARYPTVRFFAMPAENAEEIPRAQALLGPGVTIISASTLAGTISTLRAGAPSSSPADPNP